MAFLTVPTSTWMGKKQELEGNLFSCCQPFTSSLNITANFKVKWCLTRPGDYRAGRGKLKGNFCRIFHHFEIFQRGAQKKQTKKGLFAARDRFAFTMSKKSLNNPEDNATNSGAYKCFVKLWYFTFTDSFFSLRSAPGTRLVNVRECRSVGRLN